MLLLLRFCLFFQKPNKQRKQETMQGTDFSYIYPQNDYYTCYEFIRNHTNRLIN